MSLLLLRLVDKSACGCGKCKSCRQKAMRTALQKRSQVKAACGPSCNCAKCRAKRRMQKRGAGPLGLIASPKLPAAAKPVAAPGKSSPLGIPSMPKPPTVPQGAFGGGLSPGFRPVQQMVGSIGPQVTGGIQTHGVINNPGMPYSPAPGYRDSAVGYTHALNTGTPPHVGDLPQLRKAGMGYPRSPIPPHATPLPSGGPPSHTLGQMSAHAYAVGERPTPFNIPQAPDLRGADAANSVNKYYPTKRMDSVVRPRTLARNESEPVGHQKYAAGGWLQGLMQAGPAALRAVMAPVSIPAALTVPGPNDADIWDKLKAVKPRHHDPFLMYAPSRAMATHGANEFARALSRDPQAGKALTQELLERQQAGGNFGRGMKGFGRTLTEWAAVGGLHPAWMAAGGIGEYGKPRHVLEGLQDKTPETGSSFMDRWLFPRAAGASDLARAFKLRYPQDAAHLLQTLNNRYHNKHEPEKDKKEDKEPAKAASMVCPADQPPVRPGADGPQANQAFWQRLRHAITTQSMPPGGSTGHSATGRAGVPELGS